MTTLHVCFFQFTFRLPVLILIALLLALGALSLRSQMSFLDIWNFIFLFIPAHVISMSHASALPVYNFPIFVINPDNRFLTNYPAGSTRSWELTLFLLPP